MSEKIEQILEILQIVKSLHRDDPSTSTKEHRIHAVNEVAGQRGVLITTISDKYRRQLSPHLTNTEDFDILLSRWLQEGPSELQNILLYHSRSNQDRERVKRFLASSQAPPTPQAEDISEPPRPERVKQEIYRVLRDTALAREIKESQRYKCQLCGNVLKFSDGTLYAEAHHVKPLGKPHNGPDVGENIICVCPNCHALVDYGSIQLNPMGLKDIGIEYIEYHNREIYGKRNGATTK